MNLSGLKKAVLLITVIIGLSACKKEVSKNIDQTKIWTNFELFYDEEQNTTFATATFKFSYSNGTRLMLSDPSTVMVGGAEMAWIEDEGFYQTTFPGLIEDAEFTWTDLDGNTFVNYIDIRTVNFPAILSDLHYSDSIAYFAWDGTPLDTNETMTLEVYGAGEVPIVVFPANIAGATAIGIDSVNLSRVIADESDMVRLTLDRRHSPPLEQQTERGGAITGRYRPTSVQVMLLD